jgi:uncharacterized membrane protein YidH (DUF202 family)
MEHAKEEDQLTRTLAEHTVDPRLDLAIERTTLALERTQLAWVRTVIGFITSGFGMMWVTIQLYLVKNRSNGKKPFLCDVCIDLHE